MPKLLKNYLKILKKINIFSLLTTTFGKTFLKNICLTNYLYKNNDTELRFFPVTNAQNLKNALKFKKKTQK